MTKLRLSFCAVLLVTITLTFASLSQAAPRTYVSGVGDDTNPCSRTAPCKTFAGAMSKTDVNGEINALDAGGFGGVTITKSVIIDGTGVMSGVLMPGNGATGITINITASTDEAKSVHIRGLALNGVGTGANGVKVLAANKVVIEDCRISNFKEIGIAVAAGNVFVRNTTIHNNRNGINVSGGQVALNDVSITFNATGLVGGSMIAGQNNVVLFGNSQ